MGRKLFVGMLLVMVAITAPLAQAGSAAVIITPAQIHTQYEAAKSKATCTTLAEKTATRSDIALLVLGKAVQAYAKDHNLTAPDENALLQAPARAEIVVTAAGMYRRYLQYVGHRMIVSQSADCTRSIVAFVNASGVHIVAEELLAQALELSPCSCYEGPASSGSDGSTPLDLSDGVGPDQPGGYSGTITQALNTYGLSGWGYTEVLIGLALLGITTLGTTPTAYQVAIALAAIGKGLVDLEHAIENQANGGGASAGDRER